MMGGGIEVQTSALVFDAWVSWSRDNGSHHVIINTQLCFLGNLNISHILSSSLLSDISQLPQNMM